MAARFFHAQSAGCRDRRRLCWCRRANAPLGSLALQNEDRKIRASTGTRHRTDSRDDRTLMSSQEGAKLLQAGLQTRRRYATTLQYSLDDCEAVRNRAILNVVNANGWE